LDIEQQQQKMRMNGEPWRTLPGYSSQNVSLTNPKNPSLENKGEIQHLANAKKPRSKRSAMSRFAKDGHKRVARCLGYALTLATPQAWLDLSLILMARLSNAERAGLAYAALISLNPDDAHDVASLAIFGTSRGGAEQ
jgi:hypothetical protein